MYPRTILALFCAAPVFATTCESLTGIKLSITTITMAQTVAAGSFTAPKGDAPPAGFYQSLPAFCRVTGTIKPSSDSDIRFEVWMPSSGWNGKFQGIGNGGFAGSIVYAAGLANAVANGYAAASTNTGHEEADGFVATWALDHPQRIVDFSYRAIHETAEKGKAIVHAFYSGAPKHSYFSSCSNGGRQALMEAQRFPADYDGIISGAPAYDWTHLFADFIWNSQALLGDAYIPPQKVPAIESAILATCDALDGATDGLIEDPRQCHFDPARLLCNSADSAKCLTAPQVKALQRIYSGVKNSKGEQIYPGFPVNGGEGGLLGWAGWLFGMNPAKSAQFAFGTQFFGNMIFDSRDWDYKTFNWDKDMKRADDKLAKTINAVDPNLKAFASRGGKLILYHGWSDAAIPAPSSIAYYNNVVAKMGAKETDSFARMFLVPGMQHCTGGPGPNDFGQNAGPQRDAAHDIGKAIEQWVEGGTGPETVIATKYKTDGNLASGVVRTRPLCRFPQVAKYKGTGSLDDSANFSCSQ